MSAKDELAKYYKAGGGKQTKVGGWASGQIKYGVKADIAKNMAGSIQNFAKVGSDMYIHTDDVAKIAKGAKSAGMSAGKLVGHVTGAQTAKLAAQSLTKSAAKSAFAAGARATLGPAAIAGGAAVSAIQAGYNRAKSNPSFHKGKAGKSYLDLSPNKPGKYGIDY